MCSLADYKNLKVILNAVEFSSLIFRFDFRLITILEDLLLPSMSEIQKIVLIPKEVFSQQQQSTLVKL